MKIEVFTLFQSSFALCYISDVPTITMNNTNPSQESAIIGVLESHIGKWVSMRTLVEWSGSYAVHSRIASLRLHGYNIVNRTERDKKTRKVFSFYKLNRS